jgi:hypothetical protein
MEGLIYLACEWNLKPSLCYKTRRRRMKKKKKKQEANHLLGCDTLYSSRYVVTFQIILLAPSSG